MKYVTRITRRLVRAEDEWWPENRETIDVVVTDDHPVNTGLVDQNGVPIMRISPKSPMGFCR